MLVSHLQQTREPDEQATDAKSVFHDVVMMRLARAVGYGGLTPGTIGNEPEIPWSQPDRIHLDGDALPEAIQSTQGKSRWACLDKADTNSGGLVVV